MFPCSELARCQRFAFCHRLACVDPWIPGFAVGLALFLLFTYLWSSVRFRRHWNQNRCKTPLEAPLVPYWVPGLFHAFALFYPASFLLGLTKTFGSEKPLQVRAGFLRFFVFADPEHIKAIFRSSKKMTNKSSTLFALRHFLDLPKETIEFYRIDDSGLGLTPRKASGTLPDERINFFINHNVKKYLSSRHLASIGQRYTDMLHDHLGALHVEHEWVSVPDLFTFIQHVAIKPSIEAMFGKKILELCPRFIQDLLIFQSHLPTFLRLRPRWLMIDACRARKRLLQGVKRWHEVALEHSDCSSVSDEDPDWEPYFGNKLLRVRQQYESKMKHMTADARASEDLGLIFTSTSNLLAAIFWLLFSTLRDSDLQARLMKDVSECTINGGKSIDMTRLKERSLIQSVYAEVLRLYIATASTRIAEYGDITIAGHNIPRNSYLVMYSRTLALDYDAWVRAGRTLNKPLDEFDADRFLVDAEWARPGLRKTANAPATTTSAPPGSQRRFSMDGLEGIWIPYGGGDHICPGRHLAKHQMMLTFAVLLSRFDFELTHPDTSKVVPNMSYAPFGALPPICQVPFRLRKRMDFAMEGN